MRIRDAVREDVPRILEIYAPYITETVISFEYTVPTPELFTERFDHISAEYPWLVAEEDGVILGYAYASRAFERLAYAWDADVSIYLDRSARGCGIGRKLYAELEARLFDMGVVNLLAIITAENTASIAFHTRMGYEPIGTMPRIGYKFGRWLDTTWMLKRLRETDDPGAVPRK